MKNMLSRLLDLSARFPGAEFATYDGQDETEPAVPHVVIYHSFCADGFGAAWAIHQAMLQGFHGHTDVLYIPIGYGGRESAVDQIATYLEGGKAHFHIVDFSLLAPQFDQLAPLMESVTVLDHHAGASDTLADNRRTCDRLGVPHEIVFDNDNSGAILAWAHYHKGVMPPGFLIRIEDRDLWRFQFADTKAVAAAVYSYPMTFAAWDTFDWSVSECSPLYEEGVAILRAHDKNVGQLAEAHNVSYFQFHGHTIAVVNCPWFVVSDTCHQLLEKHPDIDAAAGYHIPKWGHVKWSFRARKDGIDLPALLKQYGGGGHQAAAGVEFSDILSEEGSAFYRDMQHEG